MKTTERFENAVKKLYTAFHNNELDALDCKRCAVGNLCDGYGDWLFTRFNFGDPIRDDVAVRLSKYSPEELGAIESLFVYGTKRGPYYRKFSNTICPNKVKYGLETLEKQKELQFKGLCAVVEYLCELDGIPNVMDYTKLFETENNEPKYQLL